MKHKFMEEEYTAELVYEELGLIPPEFDTKCSFVEPPQFIKIHDLGKKVQFFQNQKGLKYVNGLLSEAHAVIDSKDIQYSQQNKESSLKVKCLIKKEMPDYQNIGRHWEEKVKQIIQNISDGIVVLFVKCLGKTWDPLKERIKPSLLESDALCMIQFHEKDKGIELVARI